MKKHRTAHAAPGHTPTKEAPLAAPASSNQERLQRLASKARQPLPNRGHYEAALGQPLDFVGVLAGDPEVSATLDDIGKSGAAIGGSLLFRDAAPAPELIAHELVHAVQQRGVVDPSGGGSAEAEAETLGSAVAAGETVQVRSAAPDGEAQFRDRDRETGPVETAREQHEKRGIDDSHSGAGNQVATFLDHDGEEAELHHDHGFLDDGSGNIDESKREEASLGDYVELAKWIAKLEAAELLRPDLVDGTAAYRHFLEGGGATRTIDYERFIEGDSSGATIIASAMEDAQLSALARHDDMVAGQPIEPGTVTFRMRTDAVSVGRGGRYPYPATENWQKALGAHSIWMEMDVTVEVYALAGSQDAGVEPLPGGAPVPMPPTPAPATPVPDAGAAPTVTTEEITPQYARRVTIALTVHAEDMYNFNPGAADIATGTPDAANGRFEVTGLGHEYLNQGSVTRDLEFEASMDSVGGPGEGIAPPPNVGRVGRADGRPDGARRGNPAIR